MIVVYIHHRYPSTGLLTTHYALPCISIPPIPQVSCLARSSASPWLDLELDANLTCVSGMRQDYPSKIIEYEIIHENLAVRSPFGHLSRMYRRNLLVRDRQMYLMYASIML